MSRRTVVTAVSLAVVLLLAGTGAVYAYDASRADRIAKGMRIGGIDVGGLSAGDARARLHARLVAPLERPVIVASGERRFRLTAREAHVRVNTDELVTKAAAASRDGSFLSRAWRDLTGRTVAARVVPKIGYSRAAVQRLVDRVRVAMTRQPRDADVNISITKVEVRPSEPGRTIDAKRLRRRVEAALLDARAPRELRARLRSVEPQVTTDEIARRYPSIVTIDRDGFTLRLFKNLKLAESYRIAVGQVGLETPAGRYTIQNKVVNPSWNVPQSDWAGDLAGRVIPPGPDNPLKARWMGIYDGAGIHGTDAVNSIGTNASHGCIRMRIPDVKELYDRVRVGTPVYIV